jgi:hypothetical protein
MRNLLLLFSGLSMILLTSCGSVKALEESGDYDRAISMAVRKLSGKTNKNPKIVAALESAFNKAQERDMRAINTLKDEGRSENWERILRITRIIEGRQHKVEPLLPLYDKMGYKASFNFIKVADLKIESKEKTASYLYDRAQRLMVESRETGDRSLAREAVREFDKISNLYRNYRDVETLKREAIYLGTSYYLLDVENRSNTILPEQFHDRMLKLSSADLNSTWREFHSVPVDGIEYDYQMKVLIRNIDVSPEMTKERQYDESVEIEDGFEYVLDSRGNVMKDSLGNDIKVLKKIFIKATVQEVYQRKAAMVSGDVQIVDLATSSILKNESITVESVFENYASRMIGGDKRALSKESKRRIGRQPLPFPSDGQMLIDAADLLKPVIREKLRRFMD